MAGPALDADVADGEAEADETVSAAALEDTAAPVEATGVESATRAVAVGAPSPDVALVGAVSLAVALPASELQPRSARVAKAAAVDERAQRVRIIFG